MRDHFDAHCGMEVVLADGSLLRTGMGAMPGAATWQQYKYGFGPYLDGIFSQSNFGVVTKMGFWLLPEPEAVRGLRVTVQGHDDIGPLMEIVSNLTYSGVLDSQFQIRSPVLHGMRDADLDRLVTGPGGAGAEQWDDYARQRDLSFWNADFSFYGPLPVVNTRWTHVVERCAAIPGVQFADAPTYRFPMSDDERERVRDKQLLGIPSLQDFGNDGNADGHMDFSIVVPMTGAGVRDALKLMKRLMAESGVDVGMGGLTSFHPRALTFISSFPTYRDDRDANRRSRECFLRALELSAERGWGLYRVHPAFMEQAKSSYSFNDDALARFHERLKDALDPNGILAAGRYGIWPKQLRDDV